MENTHEKELSSLHTPDGGTWKETMTDPKSKLSEEDIQKKSSNNAEITQLKHNDHSVEAGSENHLPESDNQIIGSNHTGSSKPESSEEFSRDEEGDQKSEDEADVQTIENAELTSPGVTSISEKSESDEIEDTVEQPESIEKIDTPSEPETTSAKEATLSEPEPTSVPGTSAGKPEPTSVPGTSAGKPEPEPTSTQEAISNKPISVEQTISEEPDSIEQNTSDKPDFVEQTTPDKPDFVEQTTPDKPDFVEQTTSDKHEPGSQHIEESKKSEESEEELKVEPVQNLENASSQPDASNTAAKSKKSGPVVDEPVIEVSENSAEPIESEVKEDSVSEIIGESPEKLDAKEVTDEKSKSKKAIKGSEEKAIEKDDEKEERLDDDHDFSKYEAEEIVELVKKLARYDDMIRAEKIHRKVKARMSELQNEDRARELKKFIDGGGEEADFNYKVSELFQRYDANTKLIFDRKHQYLKELEKKKEANLAKAEVLLERLREFLDGSESMSTFKVFKEIQNEWKGMGPLPGTHYRSLWANYNALVNRFYDTRSIYFELKELDRKKNLEYKIQLCEKAEALEGVDDLKEAIIQLNELHNEFKHTGPVPLADQEPLWQRFKAASDKVYERRKAHNTVVKKELKKNLIAKLEIAEKVNELAEFSSDRIKDWNTKTREILDLQKKWEAAGGLPREKAREINKKFWSAFKSYFNRKNDFFKKLETKRTENLKLKEELVIKANELKDSTDWEETAQKFKNLQQKWKEIGPVPEKVRNDVYARFKASCDHFFNQKRDQSRSGGQEYEANLKKKKTIIKEIKDLGKEEKDIEKLKDLQEKFYEIGYVPRSEISSIKTEFNETLNEFLDGVEDIDESEKDAILLENKVEKLKHSPNADKKLYQKEQSLRKQINKIENDISIWKNNIEFFANTKNAEKLKTEFRKKIEDAGQELEHLKLELRVYASA